MVGPDDAVAGNDDADAVGANGLCHGSCALGVVDAEGNVLVGARLAVWYLAQRPPYLLLKRCADREGLDVESLANASKILVKLPLGALQNFRRCLGQRSVQVSCESAPVALGAWTLAPVAKTQFVANGRQSDFTARSAIVLKMYGLSHSFLLKTTSRDFAGSQVLNDSVSMYAVNKIFFMFVLFLQTSVVGYS